MMIENLNSLHRLVPSTRYQGSKRRILSWLYKHLKDLRFETVLDGFGGTASVSFLFKLMKKKVTFNDILLSNFQTGIALIENESVKLDEDDLKFLLYENGFRYPSFIQETFRNIYYLDSENKWLDTVAFNINMLSQNYEGELLKRKAALAFHILFQACLSKRPFNLFHRKNLHLRLANVARSFGNKTTWDTEFETLFLRFHNEISQKIFSNGLENKAICADILKMKDNDFDLVYLDPPYTRPGERSPKNYYDLYHFLEGLVDYTDWEQKIAWNTINKRLVKEDNEWDKNSLEENFNQLFRRFQDSIIVISYGEPGNPSIKRIRGLLLQYKTKVRIVRNEYKYKLRRRSENSLKEVLIIGH